MLKVSKSQQQIMMSLILSKRNKTHSAHYVYRDFNSKSTSHFQFLLKPFILDVCRPLKKKLTIFYVGPRRYSHLSVLESQGQARINLKFFLGYNITFLSIWPFMRHPCFPPKRSQKCHFLSFSSKIATALFRGYFSTKRGKMTLLRPLWWENMDDA